MKRELVALCSWAVALVATAGTYYWTGAVDGYWTNAANWQVDGAAAQVPPGHYMQVDSTGSMITNGAMGDVVHFNATCTSGNTVINLGGLVTVFGVVLDGGATAPRYTLGTGSDQRLPLERSGFFGAAATADTVPPIMNCGFAFGIWAYSNATSTYLTNLNPNVALEIGNFGWAAPAWNATNFDYNNYDQTILNLCGKNGNFTFNGDYQVNGTIRLQFGLKNNFGKVVVNGKIPRCMPPSIDTSGSNYTIELGPNGVLDGRGSSSSYMINTWRQLNIIGQGKVIFPTKYSKGEWAAGSYNLYARYQHELGVEFYSVWENGSGTKPSYPPGIAFNNADDGEGKKVSITGLNCVTGTFRVAGYDNTSKGVIKTSHPIYEVSSFGLDGVRSGLGYGPDMQINDLSTLRSLAASENCNRTIRLSRAKGKNTEDYGGIVDLAGTGNHTMACPVVCEGGDCSFTVKSAGTVNWTVPLTDTNSYALALTKAGAGTLTLSAVNTYSGATTVSAGTLAVSEAGALSVNSAITLAAGTSLELQDCPADRTITMGAITLTGAGVKISIGRHVTLLVPSLVCTGSGSVNVVLASGSSRLKVADWAGQTAPSWLTVNGEAAQVDAEGCVLAVGTYWQAAAGGAWHNADNWTAGVPATDGAAFIQQNQSALNVRIDEQAAAVKQLMLNNDAGTTTLAISNTLTFTAKNENRFGHGAQLVVGEGGEIVYSDEYFPSSREVNGSDRTYHDLHPFTLSDGSTWTIDGGHLYVTNLQGRFLVGDGADMSVTSKLSVVRGQFDFGQGGWDAGLEIRPNGIFEATGGTLVFQGKGTAETPFKMRGGRADISGNADFKIYNGNGNSDTNAATIFGTGETVFRDNARLFIFPEMRGYGYGSAGVIPETDGGTAILTFRDAAVMTNQVSTLIIGNLPMNLRTEYSECNDNRAILNLLGTGEHVGGFPNRADVGLANRISVGATYGYGELNIAGGKLNSGCYGLDCPNFNVSYTKGAPRGRVNQTGGTIYLNAFASVSVAYNSDSPHGLLIGDASLATADAPAEYPDAFRGWYNISGGQLLLNCGHLVLGGGRGTGQMVVTGGEVVIGNAGFLQVNTVDNVTHNDYATNLNFAVVGYLGGQGELVISNGTFTCNQAFYLGGVSTNRLFTGYPGTSKCQQVDAGDNALRKTGYGRLELAGGAFTNQGKFVVGAYGTGELDVMGSKGQFWAKDMVLSNDVAAVVNFCADAQGVSTVEVANRLAIAPGARITLDVRAFTGRRLALFRYSTLEGTLPEVELNGAEGKHNYEFQVRTRADGTHELDFAYIRGTAIFIR